MSDYRERACQKCGSLLHHKDDCNVESSASPACSAALRADIAQAILAADVTTGDSHDEARLEVLHICAAIACGIQVAMPRKREAQ